MSFCDVTHCRSILHLASHEEVHSCTDCMMEDKHSGADPGGGTQGPLPPPPPPPPPPSSYPVYAAPTFFAALDIVAY